MPSAMIGRIVRIVLVLSLVSPAAADIYYREDNGVPVFTDQPEGGGFRLFWQTSDLPRFSPARHATSAQVRERMRRYSPLVESIARQHAIEPALLHAVVMVESGYNAMAVSAKGAIGLMQVMPQTGRRYGAGDLYDPEQNLSSGARYLADLLRSFGGDLSLALAAYNAGENAVRRSGMTIPAYGETQRYVPAVLARYRLLRQSQS